MPPSPSLASPRVRGPDARGGRFVRAGHRAPLLALAAFAVGIAVAPDRRLGVRRSGVAVGAASPLGHRPAGPARRIGGVIGEDELTDAEVRDAVAGLLDAFIDDLPVAGGVPARAGRAGGGRGRRRPRPRRRGAADGAAAQTPGSPPAHHLGPGAARSGRFAAWRVRGPQSDPHAAGGGDPCRCVSGLLRHQRAAGAAAQAG